MLNRHGLTAICFVAGLALTAPGALADHHNSSDGMMGRGMMGGPMMGGGMMGSHMMDRNMMGKDSDRMIRRHMTSGKRSEMRSQRRRHHRGDRRFGHRVRPISHLTIEDVRHHFEHRLKRRGNDRLKIGAVKKLDDDTITADIVTVDDSLVRRLRVDRHSGRISRE